jgi:hypothetical protein
LAMRQRNYRLALSNIAAVRNYLIAKKIKIKSRPRAARKDKQQHWRHTLSALLLTIKENFSECDSSH